MKKIIFAVILAVAAMYFNSCTSTDIGEPVYGTSVIVKEGALDFAGEGEAVATIYVVTNINDWKAEKSADWVTFYPDAAQAEQLHKERILQVSVEDNDDTVNSRTATITISAGDFSETFTVTQQAGMESVVLTAATAVYTGDTQLDGRGHYDITFTYGEFDENGNPLDDNAGIVNVACLNRFIPGVYNPTAETGVYSITRDGSSVEALEFIAGNQSGASPTGTYHTTYTDGAPATENISGGRFEIDANGNFKMRFHYVEGVKKRFVYSGTVPYENREVLSAVGAYSQTEGKPINYDLRLYAGKMERNKITGYGYEILLECRNNDMYEGSYAIPPGNYTVGDSGNLTFSAGTADSGSRLIIYEPVTEDPILGTGDDNSDAPQATPITGGTLSVARDMDVYSVMFDLITTDGRRAQGQYTGEIRFRAR